MRADKLLQSDHCGAMTKQTSSISNIQTHQQLLYLNDCSEFEEYGTVSCSLCDQLKPSHHLRLDSKLFCSLLDNSIIVFYHSTTCASVLVARKIMTHV
jgi:hypothetical protein